MENLRFRKSLSVSLVVHLLFFGFVALLASRSAVQNGIKKQPLYIDLEPDSFLARVKKSSPSHQIVQTAPGQLQNEAKPDAFLGERTQTVDRQTIGNKRTIVIGKVGAQPKSKTATKKSTKKMALSHLGVTVLPKFKSGNISEEVLIAKEEQENKYERTVAPSDELGIAPQDYIQGMKEGEVTALNTKEFVFFSYFQRIRERLDLAWSRSLREKIARIYKSGRQLASEMDHVTRILVRLSPGGEVVGVQVLEESGTVDLDDAAVRAFNEAGPFPNPPQGILDRSGAIKIRWDFILRS